MREFSTFNGPPLATGYSTITSSLINRPNQLSSTNTHDPYLIKVLHSTQLSRPNVISFIGSLERHFASSDQSLNLSSIKKLLNHYIRLKEMRPRKTEQSAIALIKNALSKPNGYFSRFFSNETWFEWAEQRTALGKLISAFEAQSAGDRYATRALDISGVQQAIDETGGLLIQLKTLLEKQHPEELIEDPQDIESGHASTILPTSLSQTISSPCAKGLVAGTVASLAVQHPMPFLVGLSGCLPGVTAVDGVDLTRGLMGYYPFNGNAKDESGHNPPHHGGVQGATLTRDRFNKANSAYFFGGGQYSLINLGGDQFFNFPEITVAAWVKHRQIDIFKNSSVICMKWEGDAEKFQRGFDLNVRSENDVLFTTGYGKGGISTELKYTVDGKNIFQDMDWIFIVATHSTNDGSKIYFNGEVKAEDPNNKPIAPSPHSPLTIGAWKRCCVYSSVDHVYQSNFYGAIDDVRIYNRPLSAEEIKALYTLSDFNQGLVAFFPFNDDKSGHHNDCVVHGAALTEDMYRNPQSAYSFDGDSNYISCQTDKLFYDYNPSQSLVAWVKLEDVQNDPVIVEFGTNHERPNCGFRVKDKNWLFSFWNYGFQYQAPAPLSKWTHLALTIGAYRGPIPTARPGTKGIPPRVPLATATAYLNAQKIFEDTLYLPPPASSEGLTIGRLHEGSFSKPHNKLTYHYLNGKLDEVRVYNYSLSQETINRLYKSRFQPFSAMNLTQQITYQEDTPKVNIQSINITNPGPYANVTMRLPSVKVGKLELSAKHVSSVNYLKEKNGIRLMGAVSEINALLQTVFYTPSANYNHDFIITFKISNGVNPPLTGTINMHGQPVNDAPFIIGDGIPYQEITVNKLFSLNVTQYFSDVDIATNNDVLTFTAKLGNGEVLPKWLSINEKTGILSGIPVLPSSQSFRVSAADKAGKKVTDVFDLAVYADNRQIVWIIGGTVTFSFLIFAIGVLIWRKAKRHPRSGDDYQQMRNEQSNEYELHVQSNALRLRSGVFAGQAGDPPGESSDERQSKLL